MAFKKDYANAIQQNLISIISANEPALEKIARQTKETIANGGLIYVFGSGHSSVLGFEAFHRAGGLIPVYPIVHDFLTPLVSPKISGKLERLEGVASILFARAKVKKGDLMWIASNSGINAASIEMALECKKNGVQSIALTSLDHSKNVASRHSSGKKLYELCDIILDNGCPQGDAMVAIGTERVGPGSTISNCFLFNAVIADVCAQLQLSGQKLPVYRSANTPGADAHNEQLESQYISRIPLL